MQVDFYGYTALHAACEAGHADLIVPLLGNLDDDGDDNDDDVKLDVLNSLCHFLVIQMVVMVVTIMMIIESAAC